MGGAEVGTLIYPPSCFPFPVSVSHTHTYISLCLLMFCSEYVPSEYIPILRQIALDIETLLPDTYAKEIIGEKCVIHIDLLF